MLPFAFLQFFVLHGLIVQALILTHLTEIRKLFDTFYRNRLHELDGILCGKLSWYITRYKWL